MKIAVIAEAEQIQFERFAFHHFDVGNVANHNRGKIGLTCNRAEAGKFRANEFDEIVVTGVFVVKRFQDFGGVVAGILRFLITNRMG